MSRICVNATIIIVNVAIVNRRVIGMHSKHIAALQTNVKDLRITKNLHTELNGALVHMDPLKISSS